MKSEAYLRVESQPKTKRNVGVSFWGVDLPLVLLGTMVLVALALELTVVPPLRVTVKMPLIVLLLWFFIRRAFPRRE